VRLSPAYSTPLFTSFLHAELDTLSLHFHHLSDLPSTFCLPSLVSLSLHEVDLPPQLSKTLFSPLALPSLSALAYTAFADNDGNAAVVSHLYSTFSDVLDVLQLHVEDWETMAQAPFPPSNSVVFTARLENSSPAYNVLNILRPSIVRIFMSNESGTGWLSECLAALGDYASTGFLRIIYLPILLHCPPSSSTSSRDVDEHGNPDNLAIIPHFLEDVRGRDVTIRWYDSSVEEEYAVSPSVWRDARQRKTEKAGRSSA
jgi:hypothetical protein